MSHCDCQFIRTSFDKTSIRPSSKSLQKKFSVFALKMVLGLCRIYGLGFSREGNPGLVVIGGDTRSGGCEFESHHQILNWLFSRNGPSRRKKVVFCFGCVRISLKVALPRGRSFLASHSFFILKMGHPRILLHLFSSFQTNITIFITNVCKNVHPVYGVGIRTKYLQDNSLLP